MLARSGIAGPRAGASVVVDFTAGLVAQVVFILLGIVLYLEQRGGAGWLLYLGGGVAVFGGLLIGFLVAQGHGLFLRLARIVERATQGRAWQGLVGNAAALDREIVAGYRNRSRLLLCAFWRSLGWLSGSVEIWLIF